MASRHGGLRPGAGRKPAPIIAPKPIVSLVDHLGRMPAGDAGRQARCALALAAYGAADAEIAAALGIPVVELAEFHYRHISSGRLIARANVRHEMMRAARGDGRSFSVAACTAVLKWLEPPASGAR